ncbi:MAG: metallophosphoesterase [Clostridia bacterium]|nr:metallophosphoesterase [Clostridia bacterium]
MSIYAIADLHLSFGENKPMDIFGANWEGHAEKIKEDWISKVKPNDLVLLPGDFSWAMYLKDTNYDFDYLNELPGKKLLLKGNHDYWWTTITSMRRYLQENNYKDIDFIYNSSYEYEGHIICGTRGWTSLDLEDGKRILKRERNRLKLSLEDGIAKYGTKKEIIVCMHYPPFNTMDDEECNFISLMKQYNVKKCIYGHLHGPSHKEAKEGLIEGIEFKLVSCDYTDFKLIQLS